MLTSQLVMDQALEPVAVPLRDISTLIACAIAVGALGARLRRRERVGEAEATGIQVSRGER